MRNFVLFKFLFLQMQISTNLEKISSAFCSLYFMFVCDDPVKECENHDKLVSSNYKNSLRWSLWCKYSVNLPRAASIPGGGGYSCKASIPRGVGCSCKESIPRWVGCFCKASIPGKWGTLHSTALRTLYIVLTYS